MFADRDDFRVKKTIGSSWNVDEDDVVKTKTALKKTGDYKAPEWGVTGYPDQHMFDGLKSFQKREGLQVDGVMKPGGPTEKRLAQKTKPSTVTGTVGGSKQPGKTNARGFVEGEWDWKRKGTKSGPAKTDGFAGLTDWPGIKTTSGPFLPLDDATGIGNELPGGRKRGPDRKKKRPGEAQMAMMPATVPGFGNVGIVGARRNPAELGETASGGGGGGALALGAAAAKLLMDQQRMNKEGGPAVLPQTPENHEPKPNRANMDRADPLPPTPGFEPPDEKPPDRTESPAEPVEVEDLSGSLPDVQKPTVFVFPAAKPNEFGDGVVERKGNEATRKELEKVRDYFEKVLGWVHKQGGRHSARHESVVSGEKSVGEELKEYHVPGHFKSLKGGRFSDLTFEDRNGRIVHVQTVDVDKNGKPTQKELDAAEAIRRATGHSVLLIPKGAQLDQLARRQKTR